MKLLGVAVGLAVGCGGAKSAPITAPAGDSSPCYPYVMREGTCSTRCDPAQPHGQEGCFTGDWPLRCNMDGTCTPEPRHDAAE